jgi:hypothetical protein
MFSLILFLATSAGAATNLDRLGVAQPRDLKLVHQALGDTASGTRLAALNKIRQARLALSDRRGSLDRTLKQILESAEEAVENRDRPKAIDLLAVASTLLIDDYASVKGQKGEAGALMRLVGLTDNLVPTARLDAALVSTAQATAAQALDLAEGLASGLPESVVLNLGKIETVLEAEGLSVGQKARLTASLAKIAIQGVRRSRAFAAAH